MTKINDKFIKDSYRALRLMLKKNAIDFNKAPYWLWLDKDTRLNVFKNKVEFQTATQTLEIEVRKAA